MNTYEMKKRRIRTVLKPFLYFLFFHFRIFDLLLIILTKLRKNHPFIILLYHRIVDDGTEYLDKGPAIHHRKEHFEREIPYLKKNYRILSMDEVVNRIKSGKGFRKPSITITFDDGYLDNYILAYPVLKKHGVPAAIYLTTGLIGTGESTWVDKIELLLLKTKRDHFNLPYLLNGSKIEIHTKEQKERGCITISEALKKLPDGERRERLEELFEVLGVKDTEKRNSRIMLNWDEVQEMAKNGITIGSHSHTHPILSRMPIQKAKEEIFTSKKIIEENLGIKVKHFAFPNGREEDFSEGLRDYCREIGFESVASVIYGKNDASNGNAFALKRIGAISPVWMLAGELVKLFWESRKPPAP